MNPKIYDGSSKSASAVASAKGKPSTPVVRQSSTSTPTAVTKPIPTDSVTSCTVTLQPITNIESELSILTTNHQTSTTNTVPSTPPVSSASVTVNLQQAIRSMLESKSGKPPAHTERATPHCSHAEPSQGLPGGSPPCIQSSVQIKSSTPAPSTNVAMVSPSKPSSAKPSSLVQPVNASVSRSTLAQLSAVLTQTNRTASTTVGGNHSALIRSTDAAHLHSTVPSSNLPSNGPDTSTIRPMNREQPRSVGLGVPENSVRITAVRRQTAPVVFNRGPRSTQPATLNITTSVAQRTESQHSPTVAGVSVTGAYDKQVRQQLLYQSAAVALSAAQIDQLQQRAVSTSARPNPSVNCNSWLAATALLLQRPQPPPAHQQIPTTTSYQLSRESGAPNSTPNTHSGNQSTKGVASSSPRTVNPAFTNPG
ncbi:unnamed protein product [Echinostoma caproni]|uniref:Flocculation protein FLO11-like n=1 Tax=Echinostoma caproni TaxID=27848 RepID=A0A183AFG0_9TREM|nr:unnamed protein product [Echinostoma caproni]